MKNQRPHIPEGTGWFKRWLIRRRWKQREEKVIRNCGGVTYCPKCQDILNDQAYWLTSNGEGLGTYRCNTCGNLSEWHFGIAPVAILVWSRHSGQKRTIKQTTINQ